MAIKILAAITSSIDAILNTSCTLTNIIFFFIVSGFHTPLLPTYLLFVLGFFIRLTHSIGTHFTRAINTFSSFLVSSKRIGKFLLQDEMPRKLCIQGTFDQSVAVRMKKFSAYWSSEKPFRLNKIDLTINKSKLN